MKEMAGAKKPHNVEELLSSAKLSVARLRVIGIDRKNMVDDIRYAMDAIRSADYERAFILANRAKKDADSLRLTYRNACVAMASAADLITDAKNRNDDITAPLNLLKKAKKLFEESDFERAYRYAVDSCARAVNFSNLNVLAAGRENPANPRKCLWQYTHDQGGYSLCINILGRNYRRPCDGSDGCKLQSASPDEP